MHGHRVLIVCGPPDETELLATIFRYLGWDVATALSLAEVLDRLDPPPACLLAKRTLYLPDGSLYEVVRAARARSPAVRVVLLADQADFYDEEILRRVREQGLGLPDDGSGSDEQYAAFFEACDQIHKRLLAEEVRLDVVLHGVHTVDEFARAREPM